MAGLACNASAFSGELDSAARAAYGDLSLPLPSASGLIVCHGFGCRDRTQIVFAASDRMKMAHILRAGQASSPPSAGPSPPPSHGLIGVSVQQRARNIMLQGPD